MMTAEWWQQAGWVVGASIGYGPNANGSRNLSAPTELWVTRIL